MSSVKQIIEGSEKIGVIGSPSSTGELTIDILGTAVDKRLVGNLSIFNYMQEGSQNYALGQIIEIEMKNVWTQDPTMRGLIRLKGRVDPVTERQDTHTALMSISSVFNEKGGIIQQDTFGTVPPTGTFVYQLNQNILNELLKSYQKELFYLGNAYGTAIQLPMWFKHFGNDGVNAAGEAYHIGIFGKTGSGKSYLAKMVLCGYAKHQDMSIFILDPQGEFSSDLKKDQNLYKIISTYKKTINVYSLHNLVLTGWKLFSKILTSSKFLPYYLNIKAEDNVGYAVNQIIRLLRESISDEPKRQLGHVYKREIFNVLWRRLSDNVVIQRIYSTIEAQDRLRLALQTTNLDDAYEEWEKIGRLFTYDERANAIWIEKLVEKVNDEKGVYSIDLSEENVPKNILWNDTIKNIIIGEFIEKITSVAEVKFKEKKKLNTLVIIDEAHRLAPREKQNDDELDRVKTLLVDAIRTTRKYGLGWLFISQTLSSLDKEIINQIRVYIFGFGLGWGVERQALLEIIGGQTEAMSLYQRFKDPQSSIGEKTYSFMSYGPISPLSFSGTPLFFNAFKFPEEFQDVNFKQSRPTK